MAVKLPLFPTIGKILKRSFSELYNSMGFTILMSLIWFIGFLPVVLIAATMVQYLLVSKAARGEAFVFVVVSLLGISLWNGLFAGPVTTAVYGLYQQRKSDYPSFKSFIETFKRFYWRSAAIHWIFSLCVTLLTFNLIIAQMEAGIFFKVAGLISIYILLFVMLMPFYFHPLIYLNNKVKAVIKKTFLLVLDNLGLSLWFSFILGCLFLLSLMIPFLLILAYGGLFVYLVDSGFEAIYNKYE
jgi:uncharacterized membrane protein YesL